LESPTEPYHLNEAYSGDGVHLNQDGYDLVSDYVFANVTWPIAAVDALIETAPASGLGTGIPLDSMVPWSEAIGLSPYYQPFAPVDISLAQYRPPPWNQLQTDLSPFTGQGAGLPLTFRLNQFLPIIIGSGIGTGNAIGVDVAPYTYMPPDGVIVDGLLIAYTPPAGTALNWVMPLNAVLWIPHALGSGDGIALFSVRNDHHLTLAIAVGLGDGAEILPHGIPRAEITKFTILIGNKEIGHIRTVPHRVVDRVKSHG
jgi:hypothetical protein